MQCLFDKHSLWQSQSRPVPISVPDPCRKRQTILTAQKKKWWEKNFCFFQISISLSTESLQGFTAVLPLRSVQCHWLSTVPRPILLISHIEVIRIGFWCISVIGGKKQQTVPDFLPQPGQHVRLPVSNTPEKQLQMSSTAHARARSKSSQPNDGNMLLISTVYISLKASMRRKIQIKDKHEFRSIRLVISKSKIFIPFNYVHQLALCLLIVIKHASHLEMYIALTILFVFNSIYQLLS